MGLKACYFAENVGKWRNLMCISIRIFPQKILEIFTYCTKIMLLYSQAIDIGSLGKNEWCNLEYILLKFALNNVFVVRCNLLRFGVNFG